MLYAQIIPVYVSPTLNERNFGDLQGVPSSQHTVMFDKKQISKVRNDFRTKFPGLNGESCADIHARTIPFFDEFIVPHLREGRNVLISSHGFVIRTLIKHLDKMTDEEFNEQMTFEKTAPERCLLLAPTGKDSAEFSVWTVSSHLATAWFCRRAVDVQIREWRVPQGRPVASRPRREHQPKHGAILTVEEADPVEPLGPIRAIPVCCEKYYVFWVSAL
jgi:hypothetical protein